MSVARFIADQRTLYRVPVAFTCLILGVSVSWFYKWLDRGPTRRQLRRAKLDAAIRKEFAAQRGLHGSPRLFVDVRENGWNVSEKTVAERGHRGEILRREGLYSSHVIEWRRARDAGAQPGSALRRRKDPRDVQIEALTARAARAEAELARSKAALELMGKVSALLETLSESADTDTRSKP